MKSEIGGVTTVFVGNLLEWSGSSSTMKKYYYAGGERIGMRTGGTVSYILGDHLGSSSVVIDAAGNMDVAGYKPCPCRVLCKGEVRYGSLPTKYTYTGQYSNMSEFGLMYYNARWYDPALGRFVQADTIVPQAGDVRGWDRYAYVENNPLRYTDPSGHEFCDEWGSCWEGSKQTKGIRIVFVGEWTEQNRLNILDGAYAVGDKLMEVNSLYQSPTQAFNHVFGRIEYEYISNPEYGNYCQVVGISSILCFNNSNTQTVAHEMGHLLNFRDSRWYDYVGNMSLFTLKGDFVSGNHWMKQEDSSDKWLWERGYAGYSCKGFPCLHHGPNDFDDAGSVSEEAGDMFMNWVWDGRLEAIGFAANEAGDARRAWMNEVMVDLVGGK